MARLISLIPAEESRERLRVERLLLLAAALFLLVNFAALILLQPTNAGARGLRFFIWVACAFIGQRILEQRLPERDPALFPLVMFLSGWGLLVIDRLAPGFAERQMIWLPLSLTALLGAALFPQPMRWLRNYRYVLLVVGLGLLIATILLGANPSGYGPELWLGFGSIFFQPSEALKIILVAFLASYLGEHYPAMRLQDRAGERNLFAWFSPRIFGPVLMMWGLCVVVLVWQRDLGTALVFFMVFLLLLYVASGRLMILLSGAVLVGIAAAVAYSLFAVVQLRVDIWINPWPEADGRAYQIVQSLMAFASGRVMGEGIGQGLPTFIPVVHSDFIFAAIAEEWGLLGIVTLVACISLFVLRGLRIAMLHPERPFFVLLAVGLSGAIGIQSLLIMGGVLKIVPLTGVTLPFVSYGGSSLLVTFIISGLLLRLSAGES